MLRFCYVRSHEGLKWVDWLPVRTQFLKVRVQYLPDLQVKILNVRHGANNGHPTKLLRYSPGKVRKEAVTCRSLQVCLLPECRRTGRSRHAICTSENGQQQTFSTMQNVDAKAAAVITGNILLDVHHYGSTKSNRIGRANGKLNGRGLVVSTTTAASLLCIERVALLQTPVPSSRTEAISINCAGNKW